MTDDIKTCRSCGFRARTQSGLDRHLNVCTPWLKEREAYRQEAENLVVELDALDLFYTLPERLQADNMKPFCQAIVRLTR